MSEQEQLIRKVGQEVIELLVKKNNDYGSSFAKQYEKYGLLSGLIRMDDKFQRLTNLTNGHQAQVEESIDDTLKDLVGYGLLTMVERSKSKKSED